VLVSDLIVPTNMASKKTVVRAPTSEVRERLADLVTDVAYRNYRIILQRHGKDMAALISVEDLDRLRRAETGHGLDPQSGTGGRRGARGS